MSTVSAPAAPELRASRAIAVFGSWMLVGLFLDGWSHTNDTPETFFSPWHAVLYSGFVAALAWFAYDGWRHRDGSAAATDRLATAGLVAFVIGAIGDGLWHELFGIEADIEALLSPTHVALMVGGALMVTAPFRVAWRSLPECPTFRELLPATISLTLAVSLFLFFLMYLAAAGPIAQADHASPQEQGWGVASVLVRNVVMLGAVLLVLKRWRPPAGTFTIVFAVPAVALTGLDAFEAVALALPFVIAGVVADVLVARIEDRTTRARSIAVAVPLVCWTSYFAVHASQWGVHWPAEIWTGAVVFAALSGLGLSLVSDGLEQHGERSRYIVSHDLRGTG